MRAFRARLAPGQRLLLVIALAGTLALAAAYLATLGSPGSWAALWGLGPFNGGLDVIAPGLPGAARLLIFLAAIALWSVLSAWLLAGFPGLPPGHAPSERAPADRSRSDHAPADHAPADHAPADHAPGDDAASEHGRSDHAPSEPGPGEGGPAKHAPGGAARRLGLAQRAVLAAGLGAALIAFGAWVTAHVGAPPSSGGLSAYAPLTHSAFPPFPAGLPGWMQAVVWLVLGVAWSAASWLLLGRRPRPTAPSAASAAAAAASP